ncbi:24934_t:CDS:2, partial [Racocetra persica]
GMKLFIKLTPSQYEKVLSLVSENFFEVVDNKQILEVLEFLLKCFLKKIVCKVKFTNYDPTLESYDTSKNSLEEDLKDLIDNPANESQDPSWSYQEEFSQNHRLFICYQKSTKVDTEDDELDRRSLENSKNCEPNDNVYMVNNKEKDDDEKLILMR